MSKEVIPYETLKEINESILPKEERQKLLEKYKDVLIKFDEPKPNEALECLECLGNIVTDDIEGQDICLKNDKDFKEYYNIVKNYILKTQEQKEEYAKYKQLEEELGCPLDIREKALKQQYIYAQHSKFLNIYCRYDDKGRCYLTNGCYNFYLTEYKKSWWLREDKSE